MTASDCKPVPDFFDEDALDPLTVATGGPVTRQAEPKRKVGFYFSESVLQRFNRTFHQLKLDNVAIGNKSALAELAIEYALEDLERKADSQLLKRLTGSRRTR
ncbi:MAG: hypothetical protein CR984_06260 [Proteobacteria bacterium]|nr:MAG: hypothetical protein CR984_06260 [Pseudomonadota bacterium]PIE67302.1 MAG: hypothetical protein CSA23_04910 [Deltaproteobacteria bacterium]